MKKRYLVLCTLAGFAGGALSSYVRPLTARAESNSPEEIRAQRFTLVDHDGEPLGSFSVDRFGRSQLVLSDRSGHEVWRVVGDHIVDHPQDEHVPSGKFHNK